LDELASLKAVQLGTGSWVRSRADEPEITLVNRFFEENPTNTQEQAALLERPALVEIADVGDGPCRRLYNVPGFCDGDLFHVTGQDLYRHHMELNYTVTSTQISGFVDGQSSPDIAATRQYLWITDGFELQYTDGTAALTPITTPDDIPMLSLDVFNEYVLCVQNNSDRFYWIEPGATTIDPLNFATAERLPDQVLQVSTVGDEFWLFGEKSIEIWRATGDGDAPFQRIDGRLFNFGIFGGTAVRHTDTSITCVADDGSVYSLAGTPSRISNPSIAERTRDAIVVAKQNGF
jgi:hypothetical protein